MFIMQYRHVAANAIVQHAQHAGFAEGVPRPNQSVIIARLKEIESTIIIAMYIQGVLVESTAAVQVQMRMHLCIIRPAVHDSCCHQGLPNLESKYVILNSGCSSIMDGMPYAAPCSVHLLNYPPHASLMASALPAVAVTSHAPVLQATAPLWQIWQMFCT